MKFTSSCFQEEFGFNDRVIILAGMPLAGMITSLLLFNDYYLRADWSYLAVCIPISLVYAASFWLPLRWAYTRIHQFFPESKRLGYRLFWAFVVFNLVFFSVNLLLGYFFSLVLPKMYWHQPSLLMEYISALLLSLLVVTLYEALSFYLQLERAVAEKADLEHRHVASQLEGLRNQVNPHFLFNSLNTLVYLIPEDADRAVRFVQQLSKVYRYVLESREARIIPLATELEYLKSYLFLLQERFGDNLQVRLDGIREAEALGIVPLTLQMLFENAIKHNVLSAEKPLYIEVFTENEHLVVRNRLQRKYQVMDSTGVGLENIRSRYRLLTEGEVTVIASQQFFTVLLPMVRLGQDAPQSGEHAGIDH